jgi:hypothetical protein
MNDDGVQRFSFAAVGEEEYYIQVTSDSPEGFGEYNIYISTYDAERLEVFTKVDGTYRAHYARANEARRQIPPFSHPRLGLDSMRHRPNECTHSIAHEGSDNVAHEASHDSSGALTHEISDEVAHEISDEVSDEISDEISDEVSNEISDEVSDEISDESANTE